MTWVASVDGRLSFAEPVAAGTRAYLDAEWVPPTASRVPALTVDGTFACWGDDRFEMRLPGETTGDAAAEAVLRSLAARSAAHVPVEAGRPEILGSGIVAQLIAEEVRGLPLPRDGLRAVIDTTGEQTSIAGALSRLVTCGTLVLAGGRRDPFDVDLYADVHARGVRVIGTPLLGPLTAGRAGPASPAPPPQVLTEGGPSPAADAPWSVLIAT